MVSETKELNEAQRAQQARDLLGQVSELKGDPDEKEIIFKETSPQRKKVPIYSMRDGEKLMIPRAIMTATLAKIDRDTGKFAFTAFQEEAPTFKLGEVKCFLHPDSPDRLLLDDMGMVGKTCPAAHLANQYSKRQHAIHRHKSEWAMYQEFLNDAKEERYNQRQDQQLAATLAIAEAAGKPRPTKAGD